MREVLVIFALTGLLGVPSDFVVGNEIVVNNVDGAFQVGDKTVNNTEEPTPTTVSTAFRVDPPDHGNDGATETAGIYILNDMTTDPVNQFVNGIYIEQSKNQSLVGGAGIKCVHRGAGDCMYVAHLGHNTSSYGYESAMFGGWQDYPTNTIPKQENGFLASFQGYESGLQETVYNQGNTTAFQALVHNDGMDPTTEGEWATSYGLFYANNSLSNAFVVRVSQYADNYSQFKVMDHTANQRPRWQVFSDGQMWTYGPEATAGSQNQNSPPIILRGHYWNGSAEAAVNAKQTYQVSGAPSGTGLLRWDMGAVGSETLSMQLSDAGDLAVTGNVTNSGNTIRVATQRTVTAYNEAGNVGDLCADDSYLYYRGSARWYRVAWDDTEW